MLITQISVYLENNKGTLRSLTKTLAEKNIDMLAMSIADTTNFGIVRIIVRESDIEPAINALRENGFMAKTNHIICIATPNKPKGLDGVLAIIEENNLSIEYIYSLNYNIGSKALIALRLSSENMNNEQMSQLLSSKGITLVSQEEINIL